MAVHDVAPGYITLESRVASYRNAQPLTGRRTSTTGSKAPKSLKWPHKSLLPEELAKAGFFYYPSQSNPDNCACFLCHRSIDAWEEGDDPLKEHLKHSPNCGWAIVASIEAQDEELSREFPASLRMVEARTATFAGKWPHEAKRGWKCKTKQLVNAGWKYTPTEESNDMATCTYCSLALDGWEPSDKPLDEHFNRSPECPFFILIDEHNSELALKKSTTKRGRTSKASRLSTQSAVTIASDADVEEGDSIMSIATTKGKASGTRGRKPSAKKAAPARLSTQPAIDVVSDADVASDVGVVSDADVAEGDSIMSTATTKGKASGPRGRKPSAKKAAPAQLSTQPAIDVVSNVAAEEGDSIMSTATTKAKTSALKGRKAPAKKAALAQLSTEPPIDVASDADDVDEAEGDSIMSTATTKVKTSALRGRKAAAKRVEPIEAPKAPTASSNRGRKRKSDDEMSQPDLPNPQPKKRTTRASTAQVVIPQASAAPLRAPTFTDLQNQAGASDLLWIEGSPLESPPGSPPPLSPPQSSVADNQFSDTEHQSSDAENQFPERPNTPPNQGSIAPKTTKQWEPVDAEMFFGEEEHEHFLEAMSNLRTGNLTKAESQMSVEQWIYHTATVAQGKLLDECERMVAAFEAEGMKALSCLEAMEVV
ncbi:uncharacterized protein EAE97_011018 [Botrytis byssoidea]|uniref:Inhibitor of apoptosis repeat-containing protein n=1 Tax=Botrytis byssoidea TaxID=139641 RepID=A0A9P5LS85_9HELO|nr:uncharacterized protein EAE97_011018 [Botrytis byssoidea]KAF7922854.1 hypothetical protein EAE97_011018 [Botrytis byssoidea]